MYKAMKDFLWNNKGDLIENPEKNWIQDGLVEIVMEKVVEEDKVEEVKEEPKKIIKKKAWSKK